MLSPRPRETGSEQSRPTGPQTRWEQERGPSSLAEDKPEETAEVLAQLGRTGLDRSAPLPWASRGPFGLASVSLSAPSVLQAGAPGRLASES